MARPATAAVRLLTGEREPVRLATTGNIILSGLKTIDGVLTEVGDRVLVKNQADATTNGIYTASAGQWYRAADARTSRTMQKGTTVYVQEGTANFAKTFIFNTLDPVIGTSSISIAYAPASNLPAIFPNTMLIAKSDASGYDSATADQVLAFLDIEGSGSSRAALAAKAVDIFNNVPTLIECFGDSTMNGTDSVLGGITPEPPYSKLQSILGDYYGGSPITVTNRSVSGSGLYQMIPGLDTSGSTFEQKMAISSADIVYCNHGINDCQLSPTPTPPETYRDLLMQFVTICRKYGKIPVLQTPSPIYAGVGVLGTADKANRLKTYVTIMRDVAEVTNTQLVDVYAVISAYIHTGKYTVQELVKDGIHPTVITYRAMAFEMARPIIHPHAGINGPDQFISTIEGTTNTYPPTAPQLAAAARTGYHLTTDAIDQPKSIKVAVHISVPHLDVFIAYPIWSSGKNGINIAWDGEAIVGINQFSTLAIGVGEFVYDHEICIARDVPVGMHMLTLASGGQAFAIGLSYLRTRPSKPAKKFGPARDLWRDKAYSLMTLSGTGADSTLLMEELPHSRALDAEGTDITFTATMAKDTQFVLHGILTATGAASALSPRMGIGVGLQVGTGFCTVYQNPNAGVYTTSVLGAVDLSGTARTWRLFRPAGSANLTVYMNGVSQGTVALTGPHVGGFMGLRANGAGLAVTVQDLRDIEH